jgi:hypothetical protein
MAKTIVGAGIKLVAQVNADGAHKISPKVRFRIIGNSAGVTNVPLEIYKLELVVDDIQTTLVFLVVLGAGDRL